MNPEMIIYYVYCSEYQKIYACYLTDKGYLPCERYGYLQRGNYYVSYDSSKDVFENLEQAKEYAKRQITDYFNQKSFKMLKTRLKDLNKIDNFKGEN